MHIDRRRILSCTLLATAFAACAAPARAAGDGEFLLGVGYTRINFDGSNVLIDNRDGIHLDPVFSFAPIDDLPQVRLGGAVGFSAALDDVRGATVTDDGDTFFVSGDEATLFLFEPEVRLSWRHDFGEDQACFVEAGVGGGAVVGWLQAGDGDVAGPDDADLDSSDAALMGRVLLRAGARVTGGLAGIEASYMRGGTLDFADGVKGDVGEFYFGIFGALKF
jgi:hypothetical protein